MKMTTQLNHEISQQLLVHKDENYALFEAKLIPNIDPSLIIGVRAPILRQIARNIVKSGNLSFIQTLPHNWHEENLLHAYVLCNLKNYDTALHATDLFLPYVDNWAVCDSLSPKAFANHQHVLMADIKRWINNNHEYSVRFAIGMLMRHFLDSHFDTQHLDLVTHLQRNEYYIRMMQAWYLATALAKQWDSTLPIFSQQILDPWVRQKAIQKAIESFRITDEHKKILRQLR